ncbi:MAG: DNA replication/repair protein RecF [Clostridium sp.]|jgi:DNA replication and repair protein RecF|uniref:DNA replication/repair protein RecF n=1 Tax=Clostridium sp. TaxID=1506 RepID=UPI0025BB9BA8|nr:DNA replication/repair protein RecF [Clostridium sp.]MCH3965482.1 DNA replication/repair protein RecF [Clostridium sp.]MCI1716811.1 DNA replication/repair protein RecF [Clostridium sp.]MCI1801259.1 DNA replication/repair protein RecF [Clostridium sp.]MCI1814997.1 DNA replication/repair protein RecF [Clostridium sp.]MCI1871898.1 DNA replication/repair protein RecF [Clostridium sp.]
MYIKYLQLINFRNYRELNIELNQNMNIFIGDNAQGKTNILESIYYFSIGKSFRTNKDKELINWNGKEAYIKSYIVRNGLNKKIEIKIFKEGKKGININSIKVNKLSDLMGIFNVVMFSPEDLKIVKESPVFRRKFLDMELCKLSRKYYFNLIQYNKVLNERNALLKKLNYNDKSILDIYDEQLSKYGEVIIAFRNKYISELNQKGKIIHFDITSGIEKIEFKYMTSVIDLSHIRKNLLCDLVKNRENDIEKRNTSSGPHRDDFNISINGVDVRNYGSQGQQRTSVLTIKFASLEIIKDKTGEYPVLLLDDVLSELDKSRQKYILSSIKKFQTFITCTGINDIKNYIKKENQLFKVRNGGIFRI